MGRNLVSEGKAVQIIGVELFAAAAQAASESYATVHTGDIEEMDLPYSRFFDYIICGDILEHLKDPYKIVRIARTWLKDDGVFICSLPNVRYWKVLYRLAFHGSWDYADAGVLDKTHLRFFTRKSCYQMFHEAGFQINSSRMLISGRRYQFLNTLTLRVFEDLFGSQLVIAASKRSHD